MLAVSEIDELKDKVSGLLVNLRTNNYPEAVQDKKVLSLLMQINNDLLIEENEHKRMLFNRLMGKFKVRNGNGITSDYDFSMKIILEVCRVFDVPFEEVIVYNKKRKYVLPRQISMVLIRCNTRYVLTDIGKLFNIKTHGTVLHGFKTVDNLITYNKIIREKFNTLLDDMCLDYIPYSSHKSKL